VAEFIKQFADAHKSSISERKLHCQLQLPWIASALSQKAAEVEQRRSDRRIDIVGGVECIEHLHHGNQRVPFAEAERSLQTPVEREILIVFAHVVSGEAAGGASRRFRLRRARLDARANLEARWNLSTNNEVEAVAYIPVRQRVVLLQVKDVKRAVGEWIALVGVVILVLREGVVPLKCVAASETLAHADD
jgi:hypothetical protein